MVAEGREEVARGADGNRHQERIDAEAEFLREAGGSGPIKKTVAALLSTGVTSMVATNTSASDARAGSEAPAEAKPVAISSVRPVVCNAP